MSEKEIRDLINTIAFVWKDTYNSTTDTLYGFCDKDNYPTVEEQYEAFKGYFLRYYKTLKEDPKYIIKYVAFYTNFRDTENLVDYMIKDIAEHLK